MADAEMGEDYPFFAVTPDLLLTLVQQYSLTKFVATTPREPVVSLSAHAIANVVCGVDRAGGNITGLGFGIADDVIGTPITAGTLRSF